MCSINPLYNLHSLFVSIDFSHAVVDLLRLCDTCHATNFTLPPIILSKTSIFWIK